MSSQPISRFPVPVLEDLPRDIQQRFAEVQEKAGFIPNIFLTLARRPDEFRAFFAYHDSLMDKETPGLSMAETLRRMAIAAGPSCHGWRTPEKLSGPSLRSLSAYVPEKLPSSSLHLINTYNRFVRIKSDATNICTSTKLPANLNRF